MKTYYALEYKPMQFSCITTNRENLEALITRSYWNWRAGQAAGSNKPIEVFLQGKIRVKVTIEDLE